MIYIFYLPWGVGPFSVITVGHFSVVIRKQFHQNFVPGLIRGFRRSDDRHVARLVAEGNPSDALTELRNAWKLWRALEAPYDAARSRVAIGLACRAMGDPATAELEFEAARREFQRLGAQPDLEALRRLTSPSDSAAGGLTLREMEVLREIAAGKSNRKIAQDLGISEKTVARHVSNIFTKLGLSSRAAATAYAYQHHLVNSAT